MLRAVAFSINWLLQLMRRSSTHVPDPAVGRFIHADAIVALHLQVGSISSCGKHKMISNSLTTAWLATATAVSARPQSCSWQQVHGHESASPVSWSHANGWTGLPSAACMHTTKPQCCCSSPQGNSTVKPSKPLSHTLGEKACTSGCGAEVERTRVTSANAYYCLWQSSLRMLEKPRRFRAAGAIRVALCRAMDCRQTTPIERERAS